MRLVILQPFYLPYVGVFELVRLADTFVFYDDVQFVSQNWQCRNRVKTAQGPVWLTVPVRATLGATIREAQIVEDGRWRKKHWKTLQQAYAKAAHFDTFAERIQPFFERGWENLAELNIETFRVLCEMVGVSATFHRSSEWGLPGSGSDRVLRHCIELGATHYLSGPAARDYLNEDSFARNGIELEYFAFEHPTYRQLHGGFEPFLSVVDLIANEGPNAGAFLEGCGRPVPALAWETTS